MMKVFLVVFALSAVASAAPTHSLADDIQDFLDLLPLDKIVKITQNHINTDAEVQKAVAYLQGPKWADLVAKVGAKPGTQKLFAYLKAEGIEVEAILNLIHEVIANIKPQGTKNRSMKSYLDELVAVIPKVKLLMLLNTKLNESASFIAFWDFISSEASHKYVDEIRAMDEVKELAATLAGMGLNLTYIMDEIYKAFGWM